MSVEELIVAIRRKGMRVSVLGETDDGSSWQCHLAFRGKGSPANWFVGQGDDATAALQTALDKFSKAVIRMPVKRHKLEDLF